MAASDSDGHRVTALIDLSSIDLEQTVADIRRRHDLEATILAIQVPSSGHRVVALTGTKVKVRQAVVRLYHPSADQLRHFWPQL